MGIFFHYLLFSYYTIYRIPTCEQNIPAWTQAMKGKRMVCGVLVQSLGFWTDV